MGVGEAGGGGGGRGRGGRGGWRGGAFIVSWTFVSFAAECLCSWRDSPRQAIRNVHIRPRASAALSDLRELLHSVKRLC